MSNILTRTQMQMKKALQKENVNSTASTSVDDIISVYDNNKINVLLKEWSEQVKIPVKNFDEFAIALVSVTEEYVKLLNEQQAQPSPFTQIMPQHNVQPMFVNVNELISANNALQLENEQNKAEVRRLTLENADLKARLASLGEQV
ncbi:MAG: hypothetical protein NC177_14600 [Ruminococcus flavefaciens]|nr:hypothetical protein [Ruminococcus flavefaciens]